jgi:hypothetical protein
MEVFIVKRLMRTPSPALVIAVIALFVSLGGVSYGLATGSIDSREILNGSIRNPDFKNGTLRGQEAKRDGFGGGAIKESTLGKVKAASSADTFGGMTARRITAFTLANDQTRGVLTDGPFNVIARCRTEAPNQIAELVIQTNANDTAMDGAEKDADFDVGETRQLVAASAAAGTPAFDQEGSGAAIAADGTELLGQELYAGVGVLGQAGQCRFGGVLYSG